MGGVAIISGLTGWIVEIFWREYSTNMNLKWRDTVVKTPSGESPYDEMDVNKSLLTVLVTGSRLAVVVAWVVVEVWVYAYR